MIDQARRSPHITHDIHAVQGDVVWKTDELPPLEAEVLRISMGATSDLPIVTAVYETARPDYLFAFHGVSLDRDASGVQTEPDILRYLLVDGRTWQIPNIRQRPQLHRACIWIDANGETAVGAPYPDDFPALCAENRVLRFVSIAVFIARVHHVESNVFAERRWHPFLGRRSAIGGLEKPHNEKEIRRASKDFRLFNQPNFSAKGGRRAGDGATWAGGLEDFLLDLWMTLETLTRESGTPYGHDPTSRPFRTKMREHPGDRTIRDWLRKAGLRPGDIKSGAVTRANYPQFVAK
jgi:hypothetical protein